MKPRPSRVLPIALCLVLLLLGLTVAALAYVLVHYQGAVKPPLPSPASAAVTRALTSLFSLFVSNCTVWAGALSPSAVFYHPKFPHGVVGRAALLGFCSANQNSSSLQSFRGDGDALMLDGRTHGDAGTHLLALSPYLYSSISTDPDDYFVNSGFEFIEIKSAKDLELEGKFHGPDGKFHGPDGKIDSPPAETVRVVEFFARNALPFNWSAQLASIHTRDKPVTTPVAEPVAELVAELVASLFDLFLVPCASWATAFSPDGALTTAAAGRVVGRSALVSFCQARKNRTWEVSSTPVEPTVGQYFRQDGPILLTTSGVDGQHHVLVPSVDVWTHPSSVSPFANSAWQVLELFVNASTGDAAIVSAWEFLRRGSFVWPCNVPTGCH